MLDWLGNFLYLMLAVATDTRLQFPLVSLLPFPLSLTLIGYDKKKYKCIFVLKQRDEI